MHIANWKTQCFNVVQSLLFNNPHRVILNLVRGEDGERRDRALTASAETPLYAREAPPERTCLQTIQFVHHVLIPPGERHVAELHIHPDAEEILVVTRGEGTALLDGEERPVCVEDVVYVPPHTEHEIRNTSEEMLGVLVINAPVGEGLKKLAAAQQTGAAAEGNR